MWPGCAISAYCHSLVSSNCIMDFYGKKNLWKFILLFFAILIGGGTLWYTESFLDELRKQEEKRVEQFVEAMRVILNAGPNDEILFEEQIISSNTTIPIILTDEHGNVINANNINSEKLKDERYLQRKLAQMREEAPPFEIVFGKENQYKQYLYYQNSILLTKLRLYPMVLLMVISLFIVIAYIAFSNARKSEQDRVWNGLAKETAHQIGTPLTSLMGWIEYLRSKDVGDSVVVEMEKDVERLNTITQRFSKIGSKPSLEPLPIEEVTASAVSYLQARSPRKVKVSLESDPALKGRQVMLNRALYEWVIENLIRNAIDALEGEGFIKVRLRDGAKAVYVEVEDNGKGIPPNKQKLVFRPGYTTKRRGWGLGLSLAKRIIEEYHRGKIYVASSEIGKGTTFRISLKK